MKILAITLIALLLAAGGAAIYLAATTPRESVSIRFPLGERELALLARVPADADDCALVLSAASLERKLLANPVTRVAIAGWLAEQPLPGPWLLGAADVVVWRHEKETSYAVRFDPVRRLLARLWIGVAGHQEARWEGDLLVIEHGASRGAPLQELVRFLAGTLPPADIFFIQRNDERGDFPPIARPAVSSVAVEAKELVLVSRAVSTETAITPAVHVRFAADAMLAASFSDSPRLAGDLGRLVGTGLNDLTAGGGSLVLYDIDAGTLLPRPSGLLVVPSSEAVSAAVAEARPVIDLAGETRQRGSEVLVAFDRKSADAWLGGQFVESRWPANRWQVRLDPAKLVPVVRRLGDNRGLRFLAPRLHRASRDLERWTSALEGAASIEAADSLGGGAEELRVRIESK